MPAICTIFRHSISISSQLAKRSRSGTFSSKTLQLPFLINQPKLDSSFSDYSECLNWQSRGDITIRDMILAQASARLIPLATYTPRRRCESYRAQQWIPGISSACLDREKCYARAPCDARRS